MTLAAMRHQVDVAALQSEKSKLTTHCEHERDAKQQLQIIVGTVYNILSIPRTALSQKPEMAMGPFCVTLSDPLNFRPNAPDLPTTSIIVIRPDQIMMTPKAVFSKMQY